MTRGRIFPHLVLAILVRVNLTHAVQEGKRDHGGKLVHRGPELVHEIETGERGAPRGDEVVHRRPGPRLAYSQRAHLLWSQGFTER